MALSQVTLLGESTRIVNRITDDVLFIAKVDSDQFNLLFAPCSVSDIVSSTVKQYQRAADMQHVRLAVEIDGDIPQILLGDASRIGQVLSNFLSNGALLGFL